MRLLTPDELNGAIFETDGKTGETFIKPDAYVVAIKAQQELTNKEWIEWINENSSHSGRYQDYLGITHIGRVVYEEAFQARLKEIGNEPQV